MADAPAWNDGLVRSIERGSAWCAVDAGRDDARRHDVLRAEAEQPHINWLAVRRDARRRGAGRALVTLRDRRGGRARAARRDIRRGPSGWCRSRTRASHVPRTRVRRGGERDRVAGRDAARAARVGRRRAARRRDLPAAVAAGGREHAPRRRGRRTAARLRVPGPGFTRARRSRDRRVALVVGHGWTRPQLRHLERGDRWARRQRRTSGAGRPLGQPLVPRLRRVATTRRRDTRRRGSRSSTDTRSSARAVRASRCSRRTSRRWVSCAGSALARPVPCSDRAAAATSRSHSTSAG